MRRPQLVRSLRIAHIVNIFPLISLLLETIERTPSTMQLLVSIVRIHLCEVGWVRLWISTHQQLTHFRRILKVHTAVWILVKEVVTRRKC